ncbi:uncharacterized protein AMSG_04264 [Thecamonas trahens ATCC 50062]|uniref:HAUS augmin-like complex subunit 6 N-terminal domain-containing protein n=1 Tax=Thecamonas trahens ATCC 50062 TaxID=461836 RepID=A0A0L0D7H1_THETB|nr:hypothetical protein AMSG_04264 [Thecamonas trahens ATCC 50062]KNC48031.1 hypothetical protein AMSG_04264 [Thecamonas trahens ATCC 50062]|eukprot:XP_013759046.1 hypothetical protein AMSG_04264 [Thecamonas trahens ATCC 50062]
MDDAWFRGVCLLGLDVAALRTATGLSISPRMFDQANTKGMEYMIHFLLSTIDPQAAAKTFAGTWPVRDRDQAREFKRKAYAMIERLQAAGHLPPNTIRISTLQAASGPRMAALLWHLTDHAIRVVLARDHPSYPLPTPPSLEAGTDAGLAPAANVARVSHALRIRIRALRADVQSTAAAGVADLAAWRSAVAELTACVKVARADADAAAADAERLGIAVSDEADATPEAMDQGAITRDGLSAKLVARAEALKREAKDVQAAVDELQTFANRTAHLHAAISSVLDGSANSSVLSKTELAVSLPTELAESMTAELSALGLEVPGTGSGPLQLDALVSLWGLALKRMRLFLVRPSPDSEDAGTLDAWPGVPDLTAAASAAAALSEQHASLDAVATARATKLVASLLPSIEASIARLDAALDDARRMVRSAHGAPVPATPGKRPAVLIPPTPAATRRYNLGAPRPPPTPGAAADALLSPLGIRAREKVREQMRNLAVQRVASHLAFPSSSSSTVSASASASDAESEASDEHHDFDALASMLADAVVGGSEGALRQMSDAVAGLLGTPPQAALQFHSPEAFATRRELARTPAVQRQVENSSPRQTPLPTWASFESHHSIEFEDDAVSHADVCDSRDADEDCTERAERYALESSYSDAESGYGSSESDSAQSSSAASVSAGLSSPKLQPGSDAWLLTDYALTDDPLFAAFE